MAPYNNVTAVDPMLKDPEHGDFSLDRNSPAQGYGCQTFPSGSDAFNRGGILRPVKTQNRSPSLMTGELEVSGPITADTVWDYDTVKVIGDLVVEDGVVLTVAPGVRIQFQGFFSLLVSGTLLAVGEPGRWITFTSADPSSFAVDHTLTGCWNGIRFEGTRSTNAPSRIEYCVIEYSKGVPGARGAYPYGGGAVSMVDYSDLTLANCIVRNNVADYGGALFLYRNASPEIFGNVITGNHALENAAAVYCAYSYPRLVNNTITGNRIHNEANPYIDSTAVLSFLSKPVFTNNIVRDNDPDFVFSHSQLWENKVYYTRANDIQGHALVNGNIDADPLFLDAEGADYHLTPASPCVDAGEKGVVFPSTQDVDGDPRIFLGLAPGYGTGCIPLGGPAAASAAPDMGADEFCLFKKKTGGHTF